MFRNRYDLFQRRRSATHEHHKNSRVTIGSSSSGTGGITGRSRPPMPEISRIYGKPSNTKLPSFPQKPECRPTSPPVEVEYDRYCLNTKMGKFDRIIDCLGEIADKGTGSTEETKLSRLSKLTVVSLRGFVTFTARLCTGVYGSELESTSKRHPLSSKPTIWSSGRKCPIKIDWLMVLLTSLGDVQTRAFLRRVGCFCETASLGAEAVSPNTDQAMANPKPDQRNMWLLICLENDQRRNLVSWRKYMGGNLKSRLRTIHGSVAIREDRPKAFAFEYISDVRNRTNYDSVGAFLEGARRIIRIPPWR